MDQSQRMTLPQARALNLAHYLPLEPCRHGHTGFRATTTNACVACARNVARRQYVKKTRAVIAITVSVPVDDEATLRDVANLLLDSHAKGADGHVGDRLREVLKFFRGAGL